MVIRNRQNKKLKWVTRLIEMSVLCLIVPITALAAEVEEVIQFYHESIYGDLGNVAGASTTNGHLGKLSKGVQYIVQGTLASEDYRDSIYLESEAPFTISIIGFEGTSSTLTAFGFGPAFPEFTSGVESVRESKALYQGRKLQSGAYRFDFGAPGGPNTHKEIDHYAVHIAVDMGLEDLPEDSLLVRVGEHSSNFLRDDHSHFLMAKREWLDIEYYLSEAMNLPTSEPGMRQLLSIDEVIDFELHFRSMQEKYAAIKSSALEWQNIIQSNMNVTTSQIANISQFDDQYIAPIQSNLDLLETLIRADLLVLNPIEKRHSSSRLLKQIEVVNLKIEQLEYSVQTLMSMAEGVKLATLDYSANMRAYQAQLTSLVMNFYQLMAEDNTVQLRHSINTKTHEINSQSKAINDKERKLKLSSAGGAISAAIAASILVPQIKDLKRARNNLISQRKSYQDQLKRTILHNSAYQNAHHHINQIHETLSETSPYFERVKFQWQALSSDFRLLAQLLHQIKGPQGLQNESILIGQGISVLLMREAEKKLAGIWQKNQSYMH